MKIKPKFRKNQRVYFLVNNDIQYGRIIEIKPFEWSNSEGEIIYYNCTIEYHDPEITTLGSLKNIEIITKPEACLFSDKKSLVKNLIKYSQDIEKEFEKELKGRPRKYRIINGEK